MKENERSKVRKPHRKFPAKHVIVVVNRPYTSEKNAMQRAYNVKKGLYATVCKNKVVRSVEEETQGETTNSDESTSETC